MCINYNKYCVQSYDSAMSVKNIKCKGCIAEVP